MVGLLRCKGKCIYHLHVQLISSRASFKNKKLAPTSRRANAAVRWCVAKSEDRNGSHEDIITLLQCPDLRFGCLV